jgi:hypothetical protein
VTVAHRADLHPAGQVVAEEDVGALGEAGGAARQLDRLAAGDERPVAGLISNETLPPRPSENIVVATLLSNMLARIDRLPARGALSEIVIASKKPTY